MPRPRKEISLQLRKTAGRKEWRWTRYDSNGKYHRYWLDARSKAEAERLVRVMKARIEEAEQRKRSRSLALLYREFIRRKRPHVKGTTIRSYRFALARFLRVLYQRGIRSKHDLEGEDIRWIPSELRRKHSPATVNHILRGAKAFLNYWRLGGQASDIKPVTEDDKPIRILSPEEVQKLLAVAPDDYQAMILTQLYTGLARREMLELEWGQVDIEGRLIHATSGIKRRRPRYIHIHRSLLGVLEGLPRTGPFVFPSPKGGVRDPDAYSRHLARIVKRAGIPHCTSHDLRKTFLSGIINAGYPAEIAAALAGHADARVTREHYLRAQAESLRSAVDALEFAPKPHRQENGEN